jgi:lysozyme
VVVTTSDIGIELIKTFEKVSLKPYLCPRGCLTIGYGHKIQNVENCQPISKEKAHELLLKDLHVAESSVLRNIKVPLNQNQFDALVSFTFNVGGAALQRSTLRQKINRETFNEAKEEFGRWIYCNNNKIKGLIWRRRIESELFMGSLTKSALRKYGFRNIA